METCEVCSRPAVSTFTTWDGVRHFFCEPLKVSQCLNIWAQPRMLALLSGEGMG